MKLGPRPVSTHHRSTPHTHTRTESLDFALATHQPRSGIAPTFRTRSSASPMSSPAMSRSPSEISLAASFLGIEDPDDRSFVPSSHGNRDHDEDASIRPIAPSHSSSPARSGFHSARSGYRFRGTADGVGHARRSSTSTVESSIRAPSEAGWRSFRSNGAHTTGSATGSGAPSTKPTTVFSIESGAGHMAHIAQDVPHAQQQLQTPIEASAVTAPHGLPRPPSVYRTLTWESGLSGPSHPSPLAITSTADDDAQDAPLTPTIVQSAQVPPPMSSPIQNLRHSLVQAPKHSRHHPRGNPRPDAQPGPNASTLTLASSTFAFSPAPGAGGSVRARSIAENAGAANVLAEGEVSAEDADATTQDRRSLIGTTPPALRLETDTMSSRSPQRDSLVRTRTDQVGTLPTFDAISLRDREHAPSSARGPASAYSTYSKHRMLDDDASIRALRRRGSGESGTSKFSWAAVHSPWVGGDGQAGVTLGQPLVQMAQ